MTSPNRQLDTAPVGGDLPRVVVISDQLAARQHRRVLALNVLPLLGCVMAVGQLVAGTVSAIDLGLFLVFYVLTVTGVTVGYHRHLAHKSFETGPIVRGVLGVLASMAGQGPPIYWVATHRRHHQYSDRPGDPHSPRVAGTTLLHGASGLWHAHMGWLFGREVTSSVAYAKDLLRDSVIGWVNSRYLYWVGLGLVLPAIIGGLATQSWSGVFWGGVWGGLARLFFSIHSGYVVNSITHRYGRRPFSTAEHSTNNGWVALLTCGEGWHNNHHAFPGSARFGLESWQLDGGFWTIRVLGMLGLASAINVPSREAVAARKGRRGE